MARARKLTDEQHRELARRNEIHMRLRLEAAKHSPHQLCKEFKIDKSTYFNYMRRPIRAQGREE